MAKDELLIKELSSAIEYWERYSVTGDEVLCKLGLCYYFNMMGYPGFVPTYLDIWRPIDKMSYWFPIGKEYAHKRIELLKRALAYYKKVEYDV